MSDRFTLNNPEANQTGKFTGTCEKRSYEGPVAWLLGRQLMGSLKGTLLYTAFGNKIDPRDWMEAGCFKYDVEGDEFWFDYIADTGDGMRATYSIAYLSLSDLWVKQLWEEKPKENADTVVKLKKEEEKKFDQRLPRGSFLLVGGDTTYHLADYTTLANRFQTPFKWAFEDLTRAHSIKPSVRPLYGIPGNHDYYDLLDGFRRQFRKPIREDKENPDNPAESAQLIIPGFKREQEASYLAVELPWDWWLWGLDTELGAVDNRQRKFFEDKNQDKNKEKTPDKLIVATCAPTTVFGKYARWEDKKSAQTFFQLKLPWFFWSGNKRQEEMKQKIKEEFEKEPLEESVKNKYEIFESLLAPLRNEQIIMPDKQCRLDLSGDVHLYARYWGPQTANTDPEYVNAHLGSCDNYASVVSGSGGAFHHPSYTDVDEVQEQVLYPSKETSLKAFADRIFNPINIIKGGNIWLLGFIIAFVIYFGATVPKSSQQAFDNFLTINNWSLLGGSSVQKTEPTMLPASLPVSAMNQENSTQPLVDYYKTDKPIYYTELTDGRFWQHWLGVSLLSTSLIFIGIAAVFGRRIFRVPEVKLPVETDTQNNTGTDDERKHANRGWLESEKKRRNRVRQLKLWTFVLINIALIAFGFDQLRRVQVHLTPFGSSMLVLYSLLIGAAAFYFCIEYSEWLFEKTRTDYVTRSDWYLVWIVSLFGVLGVAAGFWYFGKYNLPVFILTDILFALVLSLSFIGIVALAYFKGGEMLETRRGKFWIFLVGVWHAILQIAIPFLMIKKGTVLSWLLALALSFIAIYLGRLAMRKNRHAALSFMWIIYGSIMLFLPFLPHLIDQSYLDSSNFLRRNLPENVVGWQGLLQAILAGIIGAIMSCIWFGWYLAVCFLHFQGHNNEVGGAGRIENFKQLIRFRLTEDSLTGYVIAVDDVSEIGKPVLDMNESKNKVVDQMLWKDGSYLQPKLIDVFRLTVKKSAADQGKL